MQDTIWADWCGDYEKQMGVYSHVDGFAPLNRFGYLACRDAKWGFVAVDGKTLIPTLYDTIWPCKISRRYIVRRNGKYGMIDCLDFRILFPCEYDSIGCRETDSGFFCYSDNDSTYLLNLKVETWLGGHLETHNYPAAYTPITPH